MAGMVLGASILRAATGAACSEPYYTYDIGSFGPDSAQVELNAPLLLTTIEHEGEWDPDRNAELEPQLELRVLGSDTPLEVLKPTYFGSTLSFLPTNELAPNTTYSVSARLVADLATAVEREKVSWQFTTGAAIREPMQLKGEWQVSFEHGRDEQFDCTSDFGSCGGDCESIGDVAVTKARITLPSVHGGFSKEYLSATLAILPDEPTVDGALALTGVEIEQGKPTELLVTMPLLGSSGYEPCFQFEATDARNEHSLSVYCVEEAFPLPVDDRNAGEPKPQPKPEPNVPIEPPKRGDETPSGAELAADNDGPSGGTSSGCSTSGGRHGVGSALGLFGMAALTRRRRQKIAP
jgi:MYXO-CTERM domain-containing protein